MADLAQTDAHICFGGEQLQFIHQSAACKCPMTFSIFLPPQAKAGKVPVVWWLSGLTCTDQNFVTKAGAQGTAAELGVAVIAPDTSPRGEGVPDDPEGAYDFGLAAGFYVNATQDPFAEHYQMYSYIVDELPALAGTEFPLDMDRQGIFGHSMGGHGALTIGLKNPDRYRSISAFAPIVSPLNCPWGHKALGGYLGDDKAAWAAHDACALMADTSDSRPLLVDQGDADNFLEEQLKPHLLQEACEASGRELTLRLQPGYDHSYYFMASFMDDHLRHHAKAFK
ncbi:MAG: S-formylglutathione hydrolase [Alphaproteobacteria bacterium]|nr:S-formylglutathione hydrolase [Alphaproteobacteria bacterium]